MYYIYDILVLMLLYTNVDGEGGCFGHCVSYYQQKVLKTFPGAGYLRSEDEVV